MINPSNSDSPTPNTFEERVTKIQNQISRFVELNRSERSDSQIYRSTEPSTSSGINLKETRHHYVPGDKIFRDVFMKMLSDKDHWPCMVQLLNVALENYRYHGLDKKINVVNAQNALNMFDARITECDYDVDCLFEALDDLYAVFYWTPCNIHYGPNARFRAPPDPGNKTDEVFSDGYDFITLNLIETLEENLKKLQISDLSVKLYSILLLGNPTPKTAGLYRKISPTLRCFIENYLQNNVGVEPNTEAFDKIVSKLQNLDIVEINGKRLCVLTMFNMLLLELKIAEACGGCLKHAEDSWNFIIKETADNYKCKVKKCPLFAGKPKYIYHSNVLDNTVMDLGKFVVDILSHCSGISLEHLTELSHNNPEEITQNIALNDGLNKILDKLNVENIRERLKCTEYEEFFEFFFLTENLDYAYKNLKEKMMNMIMSRKLLQMGIE